jgi:hypothetical protein
MFGRIWRGESRLWVTYWLWGVGGNMAFLAVLIAMAYQQISPIWLWHVYELSVIWFIFVFGAIFRSTAHYRGPRIWTALARLGVMIGVARMAAEAVLLTGYPY